MKILLIDVNCRYSSTGNIVYSLYKYLNSGRHKAAVCYGRGKKLKEKAIYKFGIDAETFLHAGMARLTGYNGCFSPLSTHRLIRFIEWFNPDVIHIHELHAYFVNISPLLRYIHEKGIKTVMTLHCEYNYTGKCGYSNDCDKYSTECGECPRLREYPSSLFFDRTKEMFKEKKRLMSNLEVTVTVPSAWMADQVKVSFLGGKLVHVVHNGVDTEVFTIKNSVDQIRRRHGIPYNKKILLGVAPDIMSHRKGGNWMMKVAERLKDKVHLILVGGKVKKGKIAENVSIVERLSDQSELSEYYSAADIFLLCSSRETFSMPCVEAMSCGTPVVAFKAGAPETLFKKPYAMFVDYGDIRSLERNIMNRLENPIEPKMVREYVIQEFSIAKMCKDYEQVYRELMAVDVLRKDSTGKILR